MPIYSKDETILSTCHNNSLVMSLLIDSLEKRILATGDESGIYLHDTVKDFTVLKFIRESLDSLCGVD